MTIEVFLSASSVGLQAITWWGYARVPTVTPRQQLEMLTLYVSEARKDTGCKSF